MTGESQRTSVIRGPTPSTSASHSRSASLASQATTYSDNTNSSKRRLNPFRRRRLTEETKPRPGLTSNPVRVSESSGISNASSPILSTPEEPSKHIFLCPFNPPPPLRPQSHQSGGSQAEKEVFFDPRSFLHAVDFIWDYKKNLQYRDRPLLYEVGESEVACTRAPIRLDVAPNTAIFKVLSGELGDREMVNRRLARVFEWWRDSWLNPI